MKRSTFIGLVVLVVLLGGGTYILNHYRILSDYYLYEGYYADVRGLQESSPVYILGVRVGKVDEIDLNIRERVRVVFAIDKDISLAGNTRAVITTGDVSGSKSIRLEPGAGPGKLAPGGTILTGVDSSMVENFHARITPMIHHSTTLLRTTDTGLKEFNRLIRSGWGEETRSGMRNTNRLLDNLAGKSGRANQQASGLSRLLGNLDSMSARPSEKNQNMNGALRRTESRIQEARGNTLTEDLTEFGRSVSKLSRSLNDLGNNTMLNDTTGYREAERSLDTFQRSVREYRDNPPPLIRIGIGGSK